MTTKASAIQKERGTPRPPADGVSRLGEGVFFRIGYKSAFADPSTVRARGGTQFWRLWEAAKIEDRTRWAGPGRWAGTGGRPAGGCLCLSGSGGA